MKVAFHIIWSACNSVNRPKTDREVEVNIPQLQQLENELKIKKSKTIIKSSSV